MTHDPREALEIVQQMIRGKPMEAWITDIRTMKSLGDVVQEALTASPGEQEPCGWQFCCPDGKWIGCDEPPANELRDEPEKFRRVYLSPPPAAGWDITDDMVERACKAYADATGYYVEFHRGLSSPSADGMRKGMRAALKALRREAPAPEGVSTPPAAAESKASVEARLREALEKIAGSHWERIGHCQTDVDDVPNLTAQEAMREARKALSTVGDEAKKSEGGPLNWQLSDDAKARIAEIDANRRHAALNAGNIVAGSPTPSDPPDRREIVARPAAFLAWAVDMFGPVAKLRSERLMRFVEEAIELAHAESMDRGTLILVTDRVYSRPPGDTPKETGQAQACLEMFAENIGLSSADEAEREFQRVQSIPRDEWQRRHSAKVAIGIAALDGGAGA